MENSKYCVHTPIAELKGVLPGRIYNSVYNLCIQEGGPFTLGTLCSVSESVLFRTPNLGRKSIGQLKRFLSEHGLPPLGTPYFQDIPQTQRPPSYSVALSEKEVARLVSDWLAKRMDRVGNAYELAVRQRREGDIAEAASLLLAMDLVNRYAEGAVSWAS